MAAHITGPFDTVEDLESFLDGYWPYETPISGDPITTTHNSHAFFFLPSTFPSTREALDYMCTVQQAVECFKKIFPYPDKAISRNEWIDWEILRVQLYTELFHVSSFRPSGIDLQKMKRWSLNVLLVCCVLGWLISVYIGRIKAENGFVVEVLYVF